VLHALRTKVRAYLGTDTLPRMESQMTTFLTLLTGLAEQQSAASAAQQASFLNLHNALGKLEQSVRDLQQAVTDGQASDEVAAVAAQISENLTAMKTAADTADDGFEPVVEPTDPGTPTEPTPGEPVDPDAPVADGTTTGRSNR
jgi:hypothetical protein